MNDYTGKICPYCKTEFRPGDDIIVCSECDMPHHKDCWVENQGCTTFGCSGTIQNADGGASSVTTNRMTYDEPVSTVFCTKCGSKNDGGAAFCVHCGNRLTTAAGQASAPPTFTQADPNNRDPYSYVGYGNSGSTAQLGGELEQLIGPNKEYYLQAFGEMQNQGKRTSWNWAAFLVSPYWFVYRKMYGWGAAILLLNLFVNAVLGPGMALLVYIGIWFAAGILGNSIYMGHLAGKAAQARGMTEPFKSQYLSTCGGVNSAAVWIALGAMLLLGFMLY